MMDITILLTAKFNLFWSCLETITTNNGWYLVRLD